MEAGLKRIKQGSESGLEGPDEGRGLKIGILFIVSVNNLAKKQGVEEAGWGQWKKQTTSANGRPSGREMALDEPLRIIFADFELGYITNKK